MFSIHFNIINHVTNSVRRARSHSASWKSSIRRKLEKEILQEVVRETSDWFWFLTAPFPPERGKTAAFVHSLLALNTTDSAAPSASSYYNQWHQYSCTPFAEIAELVVK